MAETLKIGIIGCGIGGLSAALFLRRAGHSVEIFDRFVTPSPIGSGLVIQPVGQAVMDRLGLGDQLRAMGHKIFKMTGTESGTTKRVLDVDYGAQGGETFGLAIHRGAIFSILHEAVRNEDITLRAGQNITGTQETNDAISAISQAGETFGHFDLLIDSSGARSAISPIKTRDLPYGALWATVDWPKETSLPQGQLTQCYQAARHMLGVLPLGEMPGDAREKAAIFWSEPAGELGDWPKGGLAEWKARTIALWPEFAPFLDQITDAAQMTPARYAHGTLGQPYSGRIAIIGDAAHQASPQLGQGANMALLDAYALSEALRGGDVARGLRRYARHRWAHVRLYQVFSAVFTPFYQSDSWLLPQLRNYVMNPLSRLWPVRPMLTRLVCGTLIRPRPR